MKTTNTGLYQYRVAAQVEVVEGQQLTVLLLPPSLTTGGNFSGTALLHQINTLMDKGLWSKETTHLIMNNDGGTEYVNWVLVVDSDA